MNGPNEIRKRSKDITQAFREACERVFTDEAMADAILQLGVTELTPKQEVWLVQNGKVVGKITDIKESD